MVAIGGLVPVIAGLAGVWLGPALFDHALPPDATFNHFRYLSGLLVGVGIAFWSLIPNIAQQGRAMRMLTAIVVIGGLSRAAGLAMHDPVTMPNLLALGMELVVTPLLCLWQARVAE